MKVLSFACLLAVLAISPDPGKNGLGNGKPGIARLDALQVLPRDKFFRLKDNMTEAEVGEILGKEAVRVVSTKGSYKGLLTKRWMFPGNSEILVRFKDDKLLTKVLRLYQPQPALKPPLPKMPPPKPTKSR